MNKSARSAWCQAGVAVIFLMALNARAQHLSDITIIESAVHYSVQSDGRYVVDEEARIRINTPQGVQRHSQIPLYFSSSLQRYDVLEAFSKASDGRKTPVPVERIVEQQTPQSAGAPTFDDGKVKTVIFPAVEVGSELYLKTRKTQLHPQFPGHFSMLEVINAGFDVDRAVITVTAPKSLDLYSDTVGLGGGETLPTKPDERQWRWEIKTWRARRAEMGSVALQDASPRITMTTLPSVQAAADAYLSGANPAAAVTPELRKLADDITEGMAGIRSQSEAIYRWVASNIRYVAIFMGTGSVVPHNAQEVAQVRYGDCKDHVALLSALLAAKGIEAIPVLVNSDMRYWQPSVNALPGIFNHVITYIPNLDTYLDSTVPGAPFGALAPTLLGKSAMLAGGNHAPARTVVLPLASPEMDQIFIQADFKVDDKGSLHGSSSVVSRGIFSLIDRLLMSTVPVGAESQIVSQALASTGQSGTGMFTRPDPRHPAADYSYHTEFTLPMLLSLGQAGAFALPRGFISISGISSAFDFIGQDQRTLPMPMLSRRIEERINLHLPASIRLTRMPKPVQLHSSFGSYATTVEAKGSAVHVVRKLDIRLDKALLAPNEYTEFRKFGLAVLQDLKSQFMHQGFDQEKSHEI